MRNTHRLNSKLMRKKLPLFTHLLREISDLIVFLAAVATAVLLAAT